MVSGLRYLVLAGTALSATLAVSAQAQDNPAPGGEEAAGGAGEIVVTAQRRSEALERTPVAVAVIGGEALTERAITSERDLQIATPGLTVRATSNDNNLTYSLRGQTVDAYTSSLPSVLPYVNEVQVGGIGASAFYDLQSIQVLKGPQGTLFGRNATGGAVLFTTAKPTEDFDGYALARYGEFDEIHLEGAVGGPIAGDRLLARVAGVYRKRDGYQQNLFYDVALGEIDRLGARLSLSFAPDGPVSNEFMVDYYKSDGSSISPVVYNVVPVSANVPGNPFVPSNVFFPDLVAFGKAQQERGPFVIEVDSLSKNRIRKWVVSNITSVELADSVKLKNVFGFVDVDYFDAGDLDGTRFGIDGRGNSTTRAFGGDGQVRQVSEELQLLGDLAGGKLEYVVGGYYSHSREHLRNTSFILNGLGIPAQINAGTTTSETFAGYGQATFDTGFAGFKVTGGLRYTAETVSFERDPDDQWTVTGNPANAPFYADGRFVSEQKETFKKISWTVGLQNQVTPELLVYANNRRSFRSGGFNFHAPPTPGFANASGGTFSPEVATDIELGLKYRGEIAGMPARFNLAGYNMWVDDLQRANYVAIYGALAGITVNVPKAEITGFELDGVVEVSDSFSIGGSVNYTDARFTDNKVAVLGTDGGTSFASFDTYPDTPKWSGTIFADVTVPLSEQWDLTLHGDLYAQSSNYFSSTGLSLNPGTRIDGYEVANFRIGVEESGGEGWAFSALVKNAFDQVYYTGGIGFASLFALNIAVPGEPRTWAVEARYRF